MKLFCSMILAFAWISVAAAQTAKPIELTFSQYSITAPVVAPDMAERKGSVPFFAGEKATGKGIASGLAFATSDNSPAIEIMSAGNEKPVRSITVAELFGVEGADWKLVPGSLKAGKTSQTAAYEFSAGNAKLRFIKTVEQKRDSGLPSGKVLVMTLGLASTSQGEYSARIHAGVIGRISGSKGVYTIAATDTTIPGQPVVVFRTKSDLKISDEGKSVTVTTSAVRTGAKSPATLAMFTITGTSVSFSGHSAEQAKNLAGYFTGKKPAPAMVSVTTVNKTQANPGDTLVYTIYSHNIGTAPAADIVISNPVPSGSSYVEGSAAGTGTAITVQRANKSATGVTWKYKNVFAPGDERSVSFKVIAR